MKILFDENIGHPICNAIASLLQYHASNPEVKHIQDFYKQGIPDDEWIPKIAKENWIVISADRAKKYGGPKLPTICKKFNITHILLSGRLHNEKQFEKARAIISLFPQIVETIKELPGSRFSLRYTSYKSLTLEKK